MDGLKYEYSNLPMSARNLKYYSPIFCFSLFLNTHLEQALKFMQTSPTLGGPPPQLTALKESTGNANGHS